MVEILSMPFMLRAIAAGVLVGFLSSYYGTFIIQRSMSFLGSGLAHAAFGGVALGILLNLEPLWIAIPFTIIVSLLITWLRMKTGLGADTVIGILFAVSMALGIIFLALKRTYTTDAFTYLFGSILAVSESDLWISGALALLTIISSFKFWARWAYASFDSELARADRHPVVFDDYLLSVLTAVTIVVSIKLVGIVLIAAFLVIPAASARLIANTFIKMTIFSIIFGIASALIGLAGSYMLDLPSGAVIILIQAAIFVLAAIFGSLVKK